MDSTRKKFLKTVLPPLPHLDAVVNHVTSSTTQAPPSGAGAELLSKARLANALADITGDNEPVVKNLMADASSPTLRSVAFNMDAQAAEALTESVRASDPSFDAGTLRSRLFRAEPSAVVHRMVETGAVSHNRRTNRNLGKDGF